MRNVKRKNIVKMERDVRRERDPMHATAREKAVREYFFITPKISFTIIFSAEVE